MRDILVIAGLCLCAFALVYGEADDESTTEAGLSTDEPTPPDDFATTPSPDVSPDYASNWAGSTTWEMKFGLKQSYALNMVLVPSGDVEQLRADCEKDPQCDAFVEAATHSGEDGTEDAIPGPLADYKMVVYIKCSGAPECASSNATTATLGNSTTTLPVTGSTTALPISSVTNAELSSTITSAVLPTTTGTSTPSCNVSVTGNQGSWTVKPNTYFENRTADNYYYFEWTGALPECRQICQAVKGCDAVIFDKAKNGCYGRRALVHPPLLPSTGMDLHEFAAALWQTTPLVTTNPDACAYLNTWDTKLFTDFASPVTILFTLHSTDAEDCQKMCILTPSCDAVNVRLDQTLCNGVKNSRGVQTKPSGTSLIHYRQLKAQ